MDELRGAHPLTGLDTDGRPRKPERAATAGETAEKAKRAREGLSRARNEAYDQVRMALAVVSVCGYESLMSDERLHLALDVHDGVVPWTMPDGTPAEHTVEGRHVPMLKRATDVTTAQPATVQFFASLLGHFAVNEIVSRAANYRRSRDHVIGRRLVGAEKDAWLRQAPWSGCPQ